MGFRQRIKNTKLRWTQAWRRMNPFKRNQEAKKSKTGGAKKAKFQRAIVGMSLEDLKKKKQMKPAMREEAKAAAAKEKQALKKKASAGKTAAPKGAPKPKGPKGVTGGQPKQKD